MIKSVPSLQIVSILLDHMNATVKMDLSEEEIVALMLMNAEMNVMKLPRKDYISFWFKPHFRFGYFNFFGFESL